MLSFVVVSAVVMLLFSYGVMQQQRNLLRHESLDHALVLAHTVAVSSASWVVAHDVAGLQEVLGSVARSHSLRYVLVLSVDGHVLASSDAAQIGLFVNDPLSQKMLKSGAPAATVLLDNESMIDVADPVMAGSRQVGWVRIGFGREEMAESLRQIKWVAYCMLAVIILLALLVALALSGRLTRRLQQLVSVTNQVHAGQLNVRAGMSGQDEVSVLAASFNRMLDALQRSEQELVQLNRNLHEAKETLHSSNADLERFAYSVSHDMRQPLRAVSSHLQLLQLSLKDKLDGDERENMNFALEGARRMDAMIVSLLEYSRVGRKTGMMAQLSSRLPLDEALGYLQPMIGETAAEVNVSGEWPQVFACHDELTRLFQNLIGNAIKFREASKTARVELDSSVHDKVWRVSVRDYGVGIDPKQIDRLFQFFSRLQARSRFEGTGMGLALCRRIVEHHDGRIWVESEGEGKGSVFIFELPIRSAAEQK